MHIYLCRTKKYYLARFYNKLTFEGYVKILYLLHFFKNKGVKDNNSCNFFLMNIIQKLSCLLSLSTITNVFSFASVTKLGYFMEEYDMSASFKGKIAKLTAYLDNNISI